MECQVVCQVDSQELEVPQVEPQAVDQVELKTLIEISHKAIEIIAISINSMLKCFTNTQFLY